MQSISEKLTPTEIKNKEFKRTAFGYSPQEVVAFLDATARTWESVQRQEKVLLTKIKDLEAEIRQWKDKEVELTRLREAALKDAEGIRDVARGEAQKIFNEMEEKANGIRVRTEEWLANVLAEMEETERQRNNFVTAFKSALDSHYALLKGENYEAALGQRLMHFLKNAQPDGEPHRGGSH